MSKAKPSVQKFMTYQPISIRNDETLEHAREVMAKENIRHLPVMNAGEVAGILSDRDIKLALTLVGVDPRKMFVKDICHRHVYSVSPDSYLEDVALEMANHSYGCAVVVQNGKLVGIFTTVDACRALAKIISEK